MKVIREIYGLLLDHFGEQGWWPAETPFEVMVGAVLTQNTNWTNVEKAIVNLRSAGVLNYTSLSMMGEAELAELIRPSGYYNVKARRLKNLLKMVAVHYHGDLGLFLDDEVQSARQMLLGVKGIGEETADSILLYACNRPVFVVDNYTYRILNRHNLIEEEVDYSRLQERLVDNLPVDTALYNEFHALLVRTAVTFCKKSKPLCDRCPLQGINW
jgi:endonuclease-3 related protein